MIVHLTILGIIITYCIIKVMVPNEKEPERCLKCRKIKGDGKGRLYKNRVEVTCDTEYNERLMNIKMNCVTVNKVYE
jgi:hypothetical protein